MLLPLQSLRYGLTYQSRSEQPYDRLLRRANKLRQAMGGEPGTANPIPPRRKGQWHRTYEAKLDELSRLEEQADEWGGWQEIAGVNFTSQPPHPTGLT